MFIQPKWVHHIKKIIDKRDIQHPGNVFAWWLHEHVHKQNSNSKSIVHTHVILYVITKIIVMACIDLRIV